MQNITRRIVRKTEAGLEFHTLTITEFATVAVQTGAHKFGGGVDWVGFFGLDKAVVRQLTKHGVACLD